jgi:hypothetical protein
MVQLVKSTRDFEIFGAQPWHDSTDFSENSKAAVILARCAVLGPATAVFRLISHPESIADLSYSYKQELIGESLESASGLR